MQKRLSVITNRTYAVTDLAEHFASGRAEEIRILFTKKFTL